MTLDQLKLDIEFLAKRAENANQWSANIPRDTGTSSNSIVSIAYGVRTIEEQWLPADASDVAACEEMWKKLPEHRKTGDALKAMENVRAFRYRGIK